LKKKWRFVLILLLLVCVGGGIFGSIKYSERGIVIVQTGKVSREDLTAIVTASGEVKPRNYINIGANSQGAAPDYRDPGKRGRSRQKRAGLSAPGEYPTEGRFECPRGFSEFGFG
jgi:hypothetical protein